MALYRKENSAMLLVNGCLSVCIREDGSDYNVFRTPLFLDKRGFEEVKQKTLNSIYSNSGSKNNNNNHKKRRR